MTVGIVIGGPDSGRDFAADMWDGQARHMAGIARAYSLDATRSLVLAAISAACFEWKEAAAHTRDAARMRWAAREHEKLAQLARDFRDARSPIDWRPTETTPEDYYAQ